MNDGHSNDTKSSRLGAAGWIAIVVMAGLLAWATWYAFHVWNALAGVGVSAAGWAFIVLGVVVTFGLGAGLMALVFYSSRKDFDR